MRRFLRGAAGVIGTGFLVLFVVGSITGGEWPSLLVCLLLGAGFYTLAGKSL